MGGGGGGGEEEEENKNAHNSTPELQPKSDTGTGREEKNCAARNKDTCVPLSTLYAKPSPMWHILQL